MMTIIALLLYALGAILAKELIDTIEENTDNKLPGKYSWGLVLVWPAVVVYGTLVSRSERDE